MIFTVLSKPTLFYCFIQISFKTKSFVFMGVSNIICIYTQEEDNSEKSKGKNKENKKEPEKEEEKIEEQEEEDNDAAEKLLKEEMIRKRKRGYHGDENDDDSEEEEVNDENNGKNIGFRRQQRTNEPKLSTTNKHSTCSQNPRSRKR